MKYCSENDIWLCIQILKRVQDKNVGNDVYDKINAPCNRVIFELEELIRESKKDIGEGTH